MGSSKRKSGEGGGGGGSGLPAIGLVQLSLLITGAAMGAGVIYAKKDAFGQLTPSDWVAIASISTGVVATSVGVYYNTRLLNAQKQQNCAR